MFIPASYDLRFAPVAKAISGMTVLKNLDRGKDAAFITCHCFLRFNNRPLRAPLFYPSLRVPLFYPSLRGAKRRGNLKFARGGQSERAPR
jgi:hypothetical protein